MALRKFALALGPFILTAGATLLLIFIMLAGTKDHTPLNKTFYLEADTSGISGAPDLTRWTLWNRCSVKNGVNADCTANKAAYAFEPSKNFGTTSGVPSTLLDHHKKYYYESRFAYAFFFCATIFSGLAFLTGVFALCSRLAAGLTSVLTFFGLITDIVAASLATALYIHARNAFKDEGHDAHIGVKFFSFAWASVACLILASFGFLAACCAGRSKNKRNYEGSIPMEQEKQSRTKGRFFRRRGDRYAQDEAESQTHVIQPESDHVLSDRAPTPDRSSFYRETAYRET